LSYTNVLLTVSNVLFSYTSITHLPSNHTALVWSVDANLSFGTLEFTAFFIISLVFLLVLFAFTAVLTCTRILLYFRIVSNHLKPLLDAYQCVYKKKMYYWTGFQLAIRIVFWGLSFLSKNINLMISIILLVLIIWLQEKLSPYSRKESNFVAMLLHLNLFCIFAIALTCGTETIVISIFILLAVIQLICQILWQSMCVNICKEGEFIVSMYHSAKNAFKRHLPARSFYKSSS